MKIIESCEVCLLNKQKARVANVEDVTLREQYISEIESLLANREEDDSAPYMVYLFNQTFRKYFGHTDDYSQIKKTYNSLVMSMEEKIEEHIEKAIDPLEKSMVFARIGNYIDFGAMNQVEETKFLELLELESEDGIQQKPYQSFVKQCEQASKFLLLCDNCGEVVLDKLFLRQLHKCFPDLELFAMVRGEDVLNDATMEDAMFCGLDQVATVISNGNGVAGTTLSMLSEEAKKCFEEADIILSKGQGNYESLFGCDRTVFYSFLCKCDLFTSRFQVPKYTGMFVEK